jgi:uncharacterized membrane protein YedE/YeeE
MSASVHQGVAAFVSGVLFAIGLAISGMTQPAKVIAFLDVAGGRWDPSLMCVMVGAIGVYAPFYWAVRRRGRTLLGSPLSLPTQRRIDKRLLAGAAIFGVGWGLGGYCPGPGVTALASGSLTPVIFVAAMLGASWLFAFVQQRSGGQHAPAAVAAEDDAAR